MLIYLIFGDHKKLLVNPDCALYNFIFYVRSKFGIHLPSSETERVNFDTFDLCDTEGNVMGLRRLRPMGRVSCLVEHKSSYVPLVPSTVKEDPRLQPLLNPNDPLFEKITAQFRKLEKKRHTLVPHGYKSPSQLKKNVDGDKINSKLPPKLSISRAPRRH